MSVVIVETIESLRNQLAAVRRTGQRIGLVPTMGALHAGHAALIQQARRDNDFLIVSVFVNPVQFGPNEDFHLYPRPFEQDVAMCAAEGVDLIFHPPPEELYPPG